MGPEGLLVGPEGLPVGREGLPGGQGGGGDRHRDVRNFCPFYRTFSLVGAAAQKGATGLKNPWPKGP